MPSIEMEVDVGVGEVHTHTPLSQAVGVPLVIPKEYTKARYHLQETWIASQGGASCVPEGLH